MTVVFSLILALLSFLFLCVDWPVTAACQLYGWLQRLKTASAVIDKDDAARDILGLTKPTMLDFKDMTNLKPMPQKQADAILANLKLAEPLQLPSLSGKSGPNNLPSKKRP